MSIQSESVVVELAGREREARVVERVWNPAFDDTDHELLVDVAGSTWWVEESAVRRRR